MAYLTKVRESGFSGDALNGHMRTETIGFAPSFIRTGKKSFLVFKNNKYTTVPTKNVAFFYIKYTSPVLVTLEDQEYFLNYSLDHIQEVLAPDQFYRVNRQYLVNFSAIKEVEHYFARKLLVNLLVPTRDKLIVSKEKVTGFLEWLDNR